LCARCYGWTKRPGPVATSRHSRSSMVSPPRDSLVQGGDRAEWLAPGMCRDQARHAASRGDASHMREDIPARAQCRDRTHQTDARDGAALQHEVGPVPVWASIPVATCALRNCACMTCWMSSSNPSADLTGPEDRARQARSTKPTVGERGAVENCVGPSHDSREAQHRDDGRGSSRATPAHGYVYLRGSAVESPGKRRSAPMITSSARASSSRRPARSCHVRASGRPVPSQRPENGSDPQCRGGMWNKAGLRTLWRRLLDEPLMSPSPPVT
jgi:hypothetical protein